MLRQILGYCFISHANLPSASHALGERGSWHPSTKVPVEPPGSSSWRGACLPLPWLSIGSLLGSEPTSSLTQRCAEHVSLRSHEDGSAP